jgi:undecaprenyl-diphosphatase
VLAKRLDPAERYGLRLTLFAVALALVGIPFGFLLDQIEDNGPLTRLDTYAANHLHGWVREHHVAEDACRVLSFLAVPPVVYLLMALAAAYWWGLRGHRRLGLYLLLTGWVGGAVDTVVKIVVNRDRPSLVDPIATAHGKSFPSGHTMAATYGFGALLLAFLPVIPRRWKGPAIGGWLVLVALVAFARLGLGVHYITDVIGGFVLGLAWLAAATAAFSIWRVERGRQPVHPTEGLEPEVARD